MPTIKIALPVDKEGYNVIFGNNTISTSLNGGSSRYRLDKIGVVHRVDVQWTTDVAGYKYLMAFFRTGIIYGSLPFLIDLVIDTAEADEYLAHIVPGTFGLKSHSGLTYVVIAQLEVSPIVVDTEDDEDIIEEYAGT